MHDPALNYPLGSREAKLVQHFALMPADLTDTIEARTQLLVKIETACRRERERGLAGHWTYSIARHNGMLALYSSEKAALDALKTQT